MNTVIIAVIVVGSIGLFIGIFLSLASVKFKVEVNEEKLERFFLEITVELAVILDVMALHVQLLKKKPQLINVLLVVMKLLKK